MILLKFLGFIMDIQEDSKYVVKSWIFEYLYYFKLKKFG